MAERTDAQRIKGLQALCDQLDDLRKKAEEICRSATAEMDRARRANQPNRRTKAKKVKRDRRR